MMREAHFHLLHQPFLIVFAQHFLQTLFYIDKKTVDKAVLFYRLVLF